MSLRAEDYEAIRVERRGRIAVLTLDRPQRRNAVDDVMHSELSTVFADAQSDPSVDVVVLTGAGDAFSVGGDTSADRRFETKTGRTVMQEARHVVDDVIDLEKPLVAAVNGHAIGLGATLATLADVSFVARSARIGDPHVRAALPAGNGSGVIWPLLVGINRAKQLLMTGDLMTAEEAAAIGLVSTVVDDGTALDAALELAERLGAMAPHAVQATKVAINKLLKQASNAVLPTSLALEELAMGHPAFAEAMARLAAPTPAPPAPTEEAT